jgi:V-type H+-transporting ATPase subunit a
MGFFAVYCGFLYNDFISIPIDFGSCYNLTTDLNKTNTTDKKPDCNYKFGLDPVWYMTDNELTFVNSMKMKLSVILGVFQMLIGIILKGMNAFYEKDFVEIVFIFFPQIILMLSLFGYMDFLIFAKWATSYKISGTDISENYIAPDIKSYLMNIILKGGKLPDKPDPIEDPETKEVIFHEDWKLLTDRDTLEKVHLGLLFISFACIILMFLPKIFISYSKAKKKYDSKNIEGNGNIVINEEMQGFKEEFVAPNKEIDRPVLSNFFVANSIETIEFVLGTVSNTASYLRLWALSLAHSQLADVFFDKTIISFGNTSDN